MIVNRASAAVRPGPQFRLIHVLDPADRADMYIMLIQSFTPNQHFPQTKQLDRKAREHSLMESGCVMT